MTDLHARAEAIAAGIINTSYPTSRYDGIASDEKIAQILFCNLRHELLAVVKCATRAMAHDVSARYTDLRVALIEYDAALERELGETP